MKDVNVKKAYVEIVDFLIANQNKKVDTILQDIIAMCEKQSGGGSEGSTVLKDEDGNTVAIYCYYHKVWELVAKVPYGKKANTATGLNTMCKEGVSQWTKQQRVAKEAKAQLLESVAKGDIDASELHDHLEKIEADRKAIMPLSEEFAKFATANKDDIQL